MVLLQKKVSTVLLQREGVHSPPPKIRCPCSSLKGKVCKVFLQKKKVPMFLLQREGTKVLLQREGVHGRSPKRFPRSSSKGNAFMVLLQREGAYTSLSKGRCPQSLFQPPSSSQNPQSISLCAVLIFS